MERSGYNSDVSDKQWERLQKYLPELSTRGAHLRKMGTTSYHKRHFVCSDHGLSMENASQRFSSLAKCLLPLQ